MAVMGNLASDIDRVDVEKKEMSVDSQKLCLSCASCCFRLRLRFVRQAVICRVAKIKLFNVVSESLWRIGSSYIPSVMSIKDALHLPEALPEIRGNQSRTCDSRIRIRAVIRNRKI